MLERIAPTLFVLLWSTGWIVSHYAGAQPLMFLSWRYGLSILALLPLALLLRARWPRGRHAGHAMVSGLLLHAGYLGGVWWAVAHGVEAGVSALLAAVQPILTALLAPTLAGERIRPPQWVGVALGAAGIVLVLWPKLAAVDASGLGQVAVPLAVNLAAMLSVTLGTFYQKRFLVSEDLRSVTVLQYAAAFVVTLPIGLATEIPALAWTNDRVIAMIWSVLALSIGAIMLLLGLIRRGAVSRTAQLIFLVPPTAAIQAFLLFGERLAPLQLLGMAVTATGVIAATRF